MRCLCTILFVLFGFSSVSAQACEAVLKSSPAQFRFRNPTFSKRARVALEQMAIPSEVFISQGQQSLIFPRSWGKTGLQFLVVLNPDVFPIALVVKGEPEGEGFRVESIKSADIEEQRDYFAHVAEVNHIENSVLTLETPVLGCKDLFLDGWVTAKLWLKHRLNPADVIKHINSSIQIEAPGRHSNTPHSLQIFDLKDFKQPTWLRMAVERRTRCPNRLKTIFIDKMH